MTRSTSALEAGGTDVSSDWRVALGHEVPSLNTAQFLATNCLLFLIAPPSAHADPDLLQTDNGATCHGL